jgi:hypothetical protein
MQKPLSRRALARIKHERATRFHLRYIEMHLFVSNSRVLIAREPTDWERCIQKISGEQYLMPENMLPADFIRQFATTGKWPNIERRPFNVAIPYEGRPEYIGRLKFRFYVNDYLAEQKPTARHPWDCRVYKNHDFVVSTRRFHWYKPDSMKRWLERQEFVTNLEAMLVTNRLIGSAVID